MRSANQMATASKGAAEYLQSNGPVASLLPAVQRLAALQKDCAAILPALFGSCMVLSFESGQIVVAAPTAALATKLKQQLPKLQSSLLQMSWQVNGIKIKVQPSNNYPNVTKQKELYLSPEALSAFLKLQQTLEDSPRNKNLKAALDALLLRNEKNR